MSSHDISDRYFLFSAKGYETKTDAPTEYSADFENVYGESITLSTPSKEDYDKWNDELVIQLTYKEIK